MNGKWVQMFAIHFVAGWFNRQVSLNLYRSPPFTHHQQFSGNPSWPRATGVKDTAKKYIDVLGSVLPKFTAIYWQRLIYKPIYLYILTLSYIYNISKIINKGVHVEHC